MLTYKTKYCVGFFTWTCKTVSISISQVYRIVSNSSWKPSPIINKRGGGGEGVEKECSGGKNQKIN